MNNKSTRVALLLYDIVTKVATNMHQHGCVGHTQGTTFTSHASYFDASIWLHADDNV